MTYQVPVELRLRDCYQAMALEAISEKDWLILRVTMITMFQLVTWCHRFTS